MSEKDEKEYRDEQLKWDNEHFCPFCEQSYAECDCVLSEDVHPDSPSLQDTIGEWPSYSN